MDCNEALSRLAFDHTDLTPGQLRSADRHFQTCPTCIEKARTALARYDHVLLADVVQFGSVAGLPPSERQFVANLVAASQGTGSTMECQEALSVFTARDRMPPHRQRMASVHFAICPACSRQIDEGIPGFLPSKAERVERIVAILSGEGSMDAD